MSLKQIVKKNINEVKTDKRTRLVESKIVKGRLSILVEMFNPKSIIDTTFFFNKLFIETNKMVKLGIHESTINEDLIGVLRALNGDNDNIIDTIKEKLITYLDMNLQMDNFEKSVLTQTIVDVEDDDFSRVFSDRKFLARQLADKFVTEFKEKYLEGLSDDLKEVIMNQIDTDNFKRDMEDKYTTKLESMLDSIESKMDSKLRGIRDNVFS